MESLPCFDPYSCVNIRQNVILDIEDELDVCRGKRGLRGKLDMVPSDIKTVHPL